MRAPIFGRPYPNIHGLNLRQVTRRNAPSVINSVYTFRNFWDGRASNIFTGWTPFGDADTRAQRAGRHERQARGREASNRKRQPRLAGRRPSARCRRDVVSRPHVADARQEDAGRAAAGASEGGARRQRPRTVHQRRRARAEPGTHLSVADSRRLSSRNTGVRPARQSRRRGVRPPVAGAGRLRLLSGRIQLSAVLRPGDPGV